MAAADVLNGLYEAIADNSRFETLFQAMDDFLDADPKDLERQNSDWKHVFRTHFTRVSQYMETQPEDDHESPIVFADRQLVPTAVIGRSLKIVATNSSFDTLNMSGLESVGDSLPSPSVKRRLERLFTDNASKHPQILISLHPDETSRPIFVVAQRERLSQVASHAGPFVSLRVAKAVWNDNIAPLLESAYALTPAEIDVLSGLIETGSIAEVAARRGRSVRTVRTQMTHIFGKLDVSGQTELTLFLATLTQMMGKDRRLLEEDNNGHAETPDDTTSVTISVSGRPLSYLTFGSPGGHPVLLLQPTTPPVHTPDFRELCRQNDLYILVPYKPGSAETAARPPSDGPAELVPDYKAILDHEGISVATVAGHCSGGLYALEFAGRHPDRTQGIVLVDTGAPFRGRRDLMALPKSLRRTFLPARYIPDVLLVPHRIIAANFRRSLSGEAKVVDYFFADSQVDVELVRTDRTYYDITKRIIAYSFEDIDRLVADVCRWAQDWSDQVRRVSSQRIAFVHGEQNTLFTLDRIVDLAETLSDARLLVGEAEAQLQLFQTPARFVEAVLWARDGSSGRNSS